MSYPGAAYGRDEPYLVPDIVKQFVVYLYNHIRCATWPDGGLYMTLSIYLLVSTQLLHASSGNL